jgi:S-adenosylmethionine hydrolase
MTNSLIHLITDYGVGDPAFAEVTQKLMLLSPEIRVVPTSVPSFSTIATGFWTNQLAQINPIPGMLIFTNTAPRKDNKNVRDKNEGEGLMFAELNNGVKIIGVNAGYCFSFIKNSIKLFRLVNVANKGSQFRSRDFYPEAVIGIGSSDNKFIGPEIPLEIIPDVPQNRIAWIDGYGNLKTTVREKNVHFNPGQPVLVTIGDMKRTAYFTDGSFSVHEGELAFAPGSSGGDDKFMELFLRGLSAWKEFGKPDIEAEFSISVT